MGSAPVDQTAPAHYTNGLDLHFDYNGDAQQNSTAKRKKKKKKKKAFSSSTGTITDAGHSASNIPLSAVDIWDPDEPYPNNRVIKVDKNGDVIVEPIYDDENEDYPEKTSNSLPTSQHSDISRDGNPTFLNLPGNLERSMFHFKDEQEREFWNGLSFPERQKILDINMEMMMSGFKLTPRPTNHKSTVHSHKPGWGCLCANCGQNIAHIQEEMDFATMPHISDFLETTWNMTHSKPQKPKPSRDFFMTWLSKSENHLRSQICERVDLESVKSEALARLDALTKAREHGQFGDYFKMFPHVYAAVKESSEKNDIATKPFPKKFLDQLYRYTNEGKSGVPKVLEFLKTQFAPDDMANQLSKDIADSMSEFADLLLNGEKQFVDMVEVIKKGEEGTDSSEHNDQNDESLNNSITEKPNEHVNTEIYNKEQVGSHHHFHDHDDGVHNQTCSHRHETNSDYENDEELNHSDESDFEEREHEYDPAEHEEERIEELRGLFMIQAVHLIRKRFRAEFEKKVSEDRTKQFIQELEAEENAKRERELKKLKQKEENKEKKRLQQQAKEDEKKKRLDAEREKANALKEQQEAVRAEQLRRKEELRLKKLQEKEKKIEALKKKEQEKKEAEKREQERKELERKETERIEKERLELQKKQLEEQRKEKERREKIEASLKANDAIVPSTESINQTSLANGFAERTTPVIGQDIAAQLSALSTNSNYTIPLDSVGVSNLGLTAAQSVQPTITPATNHLLEQLYHAQPRLSLGSVAATDRFDAILKQPPAPQSQPIPPTSTAQPPSTDFWVSDYLRQTRPAFSDSQGSSLWGSGYRRSSSIWGNSSGLQPWGAAPGLPSSSASISEISAPHSGLISQTQGHGQVPLIPSSLQQNMRPPFTSPLQSFQSLSLSQPLINPTSQPTFGSHDISRESIQRAAIEAFETLQQQNQLQFGAAGAHSLFLVSKGILNRPELSFSEFLRLLHSPTLAIFDLVYDDFGSVTHIKITHNNMSPKMVNGSEPSAFANDHSFEKSNSVFNISKLPVPNFGYEFKDDDPLKRQIW